VLYLGASAALEHVRQDHRCCHEVLRRRELHRGCSPTLVGGFSTPTAQQQPQAHGPHTYVQRSFVPSTQLLSVDLIFN
jgi:hypothetical protein